MAATDHGETVRTSGSSNLPPDTRPARLQVGAGPVGRNAWPRRRWLVAAALSPAFTALFGSVGPSWGLWWAGPVALLSGGLAALVLASYIAMPGSGRRLDLGCSPCAAAAAASVLGALILRASAPSEAGLAIVSIMMLAFGLAQRLRDVATCAMPSAMPSADVGADRQR